MTLAVTATRTAGDTYRFDITGVDPAFTTVTITYGDGTAPVTVPVTPPTTTVSHTYPVVGHHDYTVTVTAGKTAYAYSLGGLAAKGQALQTPWSGASTSIGDAIATGEWGMEFVPTKDGMITGIRFWRLAASTATSRVVTLWDTATGTAIGSGTSTGETGTGWKNVVLDKLVAVKAGKKYTASWRIKGQGAQVTPIPTPAPSDLGTFRHVFGYSDGVMPDGVVGNWYYMTDVIYWPFAGTLGDLAAVSSLKSLGDIAATSETVTVPVTVDVGPATIWATVVAGDPIPTVQVDTFIASGQTVLKWEVARSTPGELTVVWFGTDTQTAVSFVDTTCPLGVPVTYQLTLTYTNYSQAVVLSNTVQLAGTTGCYLTNPATGTTLRTTLVSWPERERQARRALLEVLARPDPVALSDTHSTPAGVWVFYTDTDDATAALVELLIATAVAVLRTQPGSSIPSVWVSVGNVNERRFSAKGGDARRLVVVAVQEIAPLPATALPLRADLRGLATTATTLGELSLLRPTLLQLSQIPINVSTGEAVAGDV